MADSTMELPGGFVRRMQALLGEKGYATFMAGYSRPLRRGLRVNTLKMDAAILQAHFPLPLAPVPFARDGFAFMGDFRAGADPLHHAGAYYMQEPSAMSAVTLLQPQPGEKILDLCAAPGGKSTQIAAALRGSGLLWCNEYNRPRAQILAQNLERCGVRGAVVSNTDAETLCRGLPGFFDAVLVDAPCSGEGMFRKEPEALSQWSEDTVRLCAARQRRILDAAAGSVRPGGRLVYSTCTFAPEENEGAAAWYLLHHPEFSLVDTAQTAAFGVPGLPWDRIAPFVPDLPGTDAPLTYCRRIFPGGVHPLPVPAADLSGDGCGEGHFIAVFRRDTSPAPSPRPYIYAQKDENRRQAENLYAACLSAPPDGVFCTVGEQVRLLPHGLPALAGLGVLCAGVAAAQVCRDRLEPCHALFMASRAADCCQLLSLDPADPRATSFLRGEPVGAEGCTGWTAVSIAGAVTGFGKASGGILKNRYPKGLRLRG